MAILALNTVYKCILDDAQNRASSNLQPTLLIDSGEVNVYVSNDPKGSSDPTPTYPGDFFLDTTIAATSGAHLIFGQVNWIYLTQATGTTTVIQEKGVTTNNDGV